MFIPFFVARWQVHPDLPAAVQLRDEESRIHHPYIIAHRVPGRFGWKIIPPGFDGNINHRIGLQAKKTIGLKCSARACLYLIPTAAYAFVFIIIGG